MKCTCTPDILFPENEQKRYEQQILLELPPGKERERRIAAALSTQACIDPCIVDTIKELWANGIETLGCCCGHNHPDFIPYVDVRPEHFNKMFELGFEKLKDPAGNGQLSFILK